VPHIQRRKPGADMLDISGRFNMFDARVAAALVLVASCCHMIWHTTDQQLVPATCEFLCFAAYCGWPSHDGMAAKLLYFAWNLPHLALYCAVLMWVMPDALAIAWWGVVICASRLARVRSKQGVDRDLCVRSPTCGVPCAVAGVPLRRHQMVR
jgi:hypothetical protein